MRPSSSRNISLWFFCVLLSAIFYFFSTGFNNLWLLIWFAPLPLLLLAPQVNVFAAAAAAFFAYLLGGLSVLNYMHTILPIHDLFQSLIITSIIFAVFIVISLLE